MALTTNTIIDFTARDAATNVIVFRTDPVAEQRTDMNTKISGVVNLVNTNGVTNTITVDLGNSILSVATALVVETNAKVKVTFKSAGVTYLAAVPVMGSSNTLGGKLFIETNGGTLASGDQLVLACADDSARAIYAVFGNAKY